jgi:hypothetical protein
MGTFRCALHQHIGLAQARHANRKIDYSFLSVPFLSDRNLNELAPTLVAIFSSVELRLFKLSNVLVGLTCGLRGKAHIGKGMWDMPGA